MIRALIVTAALVMTSACVYKIDVPQGNYIEQTQVDKLQVGMSKEQVKYILGNPVVRDSFNDDTWYYVYEFLSGKDKKSNRSKRLELNFTDGKLVQASGDYEVGENFYTPIEQ